MEALLAKNELSDSPFFTIAIPHYKYKEHLKIAIDSILIQNFKDYELLISDNCSPCDARNSIPNYLKSSGVNFKYFLQSENIGYDANVRFCILNSNGKYVFILGNDDSLIEISTLGKIYENLKILNFPAVAFTSYEEYTTKNTTWRGQSTKIIGRGPETALKIFRCFSFVSGLIFNVLLAKKYNIEKWDGSIYYQFYLGCKIISEGYEIASIKDSAVYINTTVKGNKVETALRRNVKFSFAARNGGFLSIICVVVDTICPYFDYAKRSSIASKIISEIYCISYAHGLIHYRVNYRWSYAFGVARMMFPTNIFSEIKNGKVSFGGKIFSINKFDQFKICILYPIVTIIGLLIPIGLYSKLSPTLGKLVRKFQQR